MPGSRRAMCACPAKSPTRRCWTASRPAFPTPPSAMPMPPPKPGWALKSPTGWKAFPRLSSAAMARWKCGWWTAVCNSARRAPPAIMSAAATALKQDGWVDTGDLVEQRGNRFYFAGRRGGIINVGGLKINPEEVEAVINRHPGVALSRVSGRRNPITGAIVVAEVVLADAANDNAASARNCWPVPRKCPPSRCPPCSRFVERLELTAGGKLDRHDGVTSWSPAARAAWAWPSPKTGGGRLSRPRPGAQRKRRAESRHRRGQPRIGISCPSIFPSSRHSPSWCAS